MTEEEVFDRLVNEFGYPAHAAEVVTSKVGKLGPETHAAFALWWNSGQTPALEVEGYTVDRLMKEHDMNPIASILTLDWLAREPDKALESLRKGHDKVSY